MYPSYISAYQHLTNHIVPGPASTSYFIPFLLLPAALCIPPSILSKNQIASLFLPLIIACLIHAWKSQDNKNERYKRVVSYTEEPYPSTLTARIPWILTLLISLRLSNWKTGIPSHDKHQPITPLTRTAYFNRALILLLQSYVILDITSLLTTRDPYFHIAGTSISSPLPPLLSPSTSAKFVSPALAPALEMVMHLFSHIPPAAIRIAILALQPYALITQGGSLPTIPIVLLSSLHFYPDEWSPHTWPLFFGPFSAVSRRGLRGVWGEWWHQTNRYLAVPGR
ncbi:MAG: hypothetical protein Q9169_006525, partial [Polycauliona sp. 2 TL-2023]